MNAVGTVGGSGFRHSRLSRRKIVQKGKMRKVIKLFLLPKLLSLIMLCLWVGEAAKHVSGAEKKASAEARSEQKA